MRLALVLALLAAGCGDGGNRGGERAVTANQIERLSTLQEAKADPQASVRLEPLRNRDAIGGAPGSGVCDFSRGGQTFLIAAPGDTVVRLGGQLLHLANAAPFGETGGFFENRQISISVGRAGPAAGPERPGSWPSRLVVTNRRTHAEAELEGAWTCDPRPME